LTVDSVVSVVTEADLPDLVPLVADYLDFYETPQAPAAIEQHCRALLVDSEHDGVRLIARGGSGAVGFATIYWTWSTTRLGRLAVMSDLFVAPEARGSGAAEALILACRDRARERGCVALQWQTAPDNRRALAVYERVGGKRSEWLTDELPCSASPGGQARKPAPGAAGLRTATPPASAQGSR